jgi:hypothetical protein
MVERLCASVPPRRAHTGPTGLAANKSGVAAQICAGVRPDHEIGRPLQCTSTGSSASAATAAVLMGAFMVSFKLAAREHSRPRPSSRPFTGSF